MRDELDKQLCEKYPKIFIERHGDMRETCMCWGFCVGDGWYDLIDNLCALIQHHIDYPPSRMVEVEGQKPTFVRDSIEQVVAAQVKEKFGGLRFYTNGSDNYVQGLIAFAEGMSYKICEECGNPGKFQPGGWVRTLCDSCQAKRT